MAVIPDLIGNSPVLVSLRAQVERLLDVHGAARRLPPILLQGATGTGKSLLAGAIHTRGRRANRPFVNVDCAAIPGTLLEAELFGFERGAFTDARHGKPGLWEEAHGGVLFLDEIATLSLGLQAKLLKTIDERTVRRLGSTKSVAVDVWVIAATAEPLGAAVREGRFRADLHHRLSGFVFELPPLSHRGADTLLLADHLLAAACADYGLPAKTLTADARAALLAHAWPGNVRELSNVMERLVLLSEDDVLTGAAVKAAIGLPVAGEPATAAASTTMLRESLETFERDRLVEALEQSDWNVTRAAERLGLPRNTLRYRIEKHGVRPPSSRRRRRAVGPASAAERRPVWFLRVALDGGQAHAAIASTVVEHLAQKLLSFGGRVLRADTTGVAGVFGLEAAEDVPSRAADAALASMRAVAASRAGSPHPFVGRGAIAVGSLGAGRGPAGSIAPDDVAVAMAALDDLIARAEPAAIVLGPGVAPFLERRFTVRGGFRLLGVESTGYGLGGRALSPFVGRRGERQAFADALDQAARGIGRVVAVVGDAGAGKSRLAYEFRRASGDQAAWLEGRCVSWGHDVPYVPLVEMLRGGIGATEGDAVEVVVAKLDAALARAQVDPALAPYLLELLGIGDRGVAALSPEVVRARTFDAFRRFVLGQAAGGPGVVVVEDLHWIDRTSEAFLASLVDAIARSPVLLVTTYRPGYRPPWSDRSYAAQLALPPLAGDESRVVVDAIAAGTALSASARQAIVDRADGNPFHLEELAWAAVAAGAVAPVSVADTVRDVLLARMDALPADTRRVLDTAAVLGRQFSPALLAAIADGVSDLRAHLRELERREFAYQRGAGDEAVHVFKHALTQEVAYGSLDPARRRQLNAAAGRALEAHYAGRLEEAWDRLAHHWSEAGDDTRAIAYLSRLAERAMRTFSFEEALAASERARAHAGRLADGAARDTAILDLVSRQALALLLAGRLDQARDVMLREQQRAERVTDPRVAAIYYAWLARGQRPVDVEAAVVAARRAMAFAEASGDAFALAAASFELCMQSFWAGTFQEGVEHGRHAVRALGPTMDSFLHAFIAGQASWMAGMNAIAAGDFATGRQEAERAIAIGAAGANQRTESFALRNAGWIATRLGDHDRAVADCRRALDLATDQFTRVLASAWLGHALAERGDGADAVARLIDAVDVFHKLVFPQYEGWTSAWLAFALVRESRLAEAAAAARMAVTLGVATRFRYGEALGHQALGRVAIAADDLAGARRHLECALALFEALGARYDLAATHLDAASAVGEADLAAAARHLDLATQGFADVGAVRMLSRVDAMARESGRSC